MTTARANSLEQSGSSAQATQATTLCIIPGHTAQAIEHRRALPEERKSRLESLHERGRKGISITAFNLRGGSPSSIPSRTICRSEN